MQGEHSDVTHPITVTTIKKQLAHAAPDITGAAADHILALTPRHAAAQTDVVSRIDDVEGYITALTSALANSAPDSFKQFVQATVDGAVTPERARIVVEVLGQVIRQQMGEEVWSFVKPILDPALEWLGTQTKAFTSMQHVDASNTVPLYTRTILQGDRIQAERLVFDALAQGHNVRDIYLDIIQPSLYEVGRLWEVGQISIAQEHLATAITQSVLSAIYARVKLPANLEQRALIACLEGNFHEIGPRMLADFLQMAGYNTHFLGTNTSVDCLIEMIETHKPVVIGLPATIQDHVDTVKSAIDRVRVDFASYRPIIMVGGLAFNLVDGLWKTVKADLWSADGGHAVDQLVGSSDWA